MRELTNPKALSGLERRLGYVFEDKQLLIRALVHRSFANESSDPMRDNQRLEFLGDAILGAAICEALFQRHTKYQEGELSRLKSDLVCEPALAEVADELDLGAHLLLGRGEAGSGGRSKPSLLADAYEAVVAAVFIDGGFGAARDLVLRHHAARLARVSVAERVRDAKSSLQELTQRGGARPKYAIVNETGPQHARVFTAEVSVAGQVVGRGEGRSKKEAQQAAASAALAVLGRE